MPSGSLGISKWSKRKDGQRTILCKSSLEHWQCGGDREWKAQQTQDHRGNVWEPLWEIGWMSVYKYARCKMNSQTENLTVNIAKSLLQDMIP